ncbi:MAG: hypothetical protein D5R99_07145 [Methanocalculus sp. MSAO_Arc1]|nr:MAG: hypothetical protein D5R99_07145 [Methanocalculus sp. MSAO_Arc1]
MREQLIPIPTLLQRSDRQVFPEFFGTWEMIQGKRSRCNNREHLGVTKSSCSADIGGGVKRREQDDRDDKPLLIRAT